MNSLYVYRMGSDDLYDYAAIKEITGASKSKLQRIMNREGLKAVKYKNRHLFKEEIVIKAMEAILIEKLKRMV